MIIKAIRTPQHQPEGSPGYADHPSLTPLRRGFFFSAHLRLGKSIIPDLRGAPTDRVRIGQKAVPGERFELPTNGLQNRCSTTELTRHVFAFLARKVGRLPPYRQRASRLHLKSRVLP